MRDQVIKALSVTFAAMLLAGCSGKAADNSVNTESSSAVFDSSFKSGSESSSASTVSSSQNEASEEIFAMDTVMDVTAYGNNANDAVEAAIDEIERLDSVLSTGDENSDIAKINANSGGELGEDAGYLVEKSLELYKETDGAFDIAIYPVMEAWGFTTQEFKVPDDNELLEKLKLTDASKINYDSKERSISFGIDGMEIDLGGIAKGYTSSRIMEIFKDYNVDSGLVNLGGNVQAYGTKTDGSNWRVAIKNPDTANDDTDDYIGILSIADKAVITSGGYERYFEQDGKTYHHIIDPSTGYPAENGLISVTIVSDDGTLADGLSTSLFIMGKDKAVEFWKAHSDEFDAVLVADDGTIYVTEGIKDSFTSDGTVEVVSK